MDFPGCRHSRIVAHLYSRCLGASPVDDDDDVDGKEEEEEEEKQRTTTPAPNFVRTASPGAIFRVMVQQQEKREMFVWIACKHKREGIPPFLYTIVLGVSIVVYLSYFLEAEDAPWSVEPDEHEPPCNACSIHFYLTTSSQQQNSYLHRTHETDARVNLLRRWCRSGCMPHIVRTTIQIS